MKKSFLQNLQPSLDAGKYLCLARNPAGTTPLRDAHSYYLQFLGIEAVPVKCLILVCSFGNHLDKLRFPGNMHMVCALLFLFGFCKGQFDKFLKGLLRWHWYSQTITQVQ